MEVHELSQPEAYDKGSYDYRFFLNWFAECIKRIQFDTENIFDLYDPLRCPTSLLWLLGDTMGYKYDDRLCPAFCRMVLLNFMQMMRLKGSKNGVTLAAEINLSQFNINAYGKEDEIYMDRLKDTSVPVNSVSVTPHVAEGYIDVVYASTEEPIDACIEYVRPLGMNIIQSSGITINANSKIFVDARLVNHNDSMLNIGVTRVGGYTREDYARLQKSTFNQDSHIQFNDEDHTRQKAWIANKDFEGEPSRNAGYRTLYSLQISNNEHITKSLIDPIYSLGYTEEDVSVVGNTNISQKNLVYNRSKDAEITVRVGTLDESRPQTQDKPAPQVNSEIAKLGDTIQ